MQGLLREAIGFVRIAQLREKQRGQGPPARLYTNGKLVGRIRP
jgi:hypothetical protein